MQYSVEVSKHINRWVLIEADSPESAVASVANGQGEERSSRVEFHYRPEERIRPGLAKEGKE